MSEDIKVYIAAPFFNDRQKGVVAGIELALFNALSSASMTFYSPRSEGILKDMNSKERAERMKYIFDKNIEMLNWCNYVVAFIDDYDTGTVFEMGYAFSAGKKIVTYTDNYYGINVMLNECIVGHCTSIDNIVPALLGNFTGDKTEDVI